MKKRMLAMLLCLTMVLSLLPMAALAAEDNVLYVGGTNVIAGGYWKGDGAGGLTEGSESDYTVWYEPSANTLTLKDAFITKAFTKHTIEEITQYVYDEDFNESEETGYEEIIAAYGIYSSSDLTLVVEGTNTITLPDMDASLSEASHDLAFIDLCLISAGISGSTLTVSGTGSCTVTAGNLDCDGTTSASSSGSIADDLIVQGGTLESVGGALIGTGIELTKGSGKGYTRGIAAGNFSISGGTLTGRGGNVADETWGDSYGLNTMSVAVSGGTLAGFGGNGGSSYGVYTHNTLTISGGNVAGYGGSSKYYSHGIYNSMDNIIMTGGTLKGVSAEGEDSAHFCGICFGSNFCSASLPETYWWRDSADGSYISSAEESCLFEYPAFDGCYHFNRVPYMEVTSEMPSNDDTSLLYVGGTDVSGGGYWKGDGAGGLTAGTAGNYTVRYEPETKTLTLRDAEISQAYTEEVDNSSFVQDIVISAYGIYCITDLNLQLEGTSTITLPSMSQNDFNSYLGEIFATAISRGISAECLTVSGDGSCTVTGGHIECDNIDHAYAYGISANTLIMRSGNLTAVGGSLSGSPIQEIHSGFCCSTGLEVNALSMLGGNLTGCGGTVENAIGYGISVYNDDFSISDGFLTGYGSDGADLSYGIFVDSTNINMTGGAIKGVAGHSTNDGDAIGIVVGSNDCTVSLPATYWWRTGEDSAYVSGTDDSCLYEVPWFNTYHFNDAPYLEVTTDYTPTATTAWQVSAVSAKHGSVSVSPSTAKQGDSVTITVTPDTGYQLDKIIAVDASGTAIALTDQGNGTYTFTMPASNVSISASFAALEIPVTFLPFTDVTASDWFYEGVAYAYHNGLMTGTSATTFSPNGTTTRGMIVTILHRLEGCPAAEASGFTDVESGLWYQSAVDWAAANGIVNGTSETTFAPTAPITREQMAAILYRYAAYKGYDVSQLADLSRFSDASNVSAYALDALAWANAAGLITGVTDTSLAPQGSAIRAQAATILMRFCESTAQ